MAMTSGIYNIPEINPVVEIRGKDWKTERFRAHKLGGHTRNEPCAEGSVRDRVARYNHQGVGRQFEQIEDDYDWKYEWNLVH